MNRLYVRVSPILAVSPHPTSRLHSGLPTGALRISPAHTNPHCPFLNRSDNPEDHEVHELDIRLAEHPLFAQLGTCQHCTRRESGGILNQKRRT